MLHGADTRGFRRPKRCISATVRTPAYYAYTYTLWRRAAIGFNCEAQDGKAHASERSLTDAPRPRSDARVKIARPCQGSHKCPCRPIFAGLPAPPRLASPCRTEERRV